jgi:hypothetical protein
MSDPHDFWRRPSDESVAAPSPVVPTQAYAGPPPTAPPLHWVPAPVIRPPAPPRALPPQDHAALDAQDRQAQLVSYGVGIAAGALALLLVAVIVLRLTA